VFSCSSLSGGTDFRFADNCGVDGYLLGYCRGVHFQAVNGCAFVQAVSVLCCLMLISVEGEKSMREAVVVLPGARLLLAFRGLHGCAHRFDALDS